jgi:SAM-dependent methyltransferase
VDTYAELNRANWDDRAGIHAVSKTYDLPAYTDTQHISSIVHFDLPRLGDLTGLDGVHLQCHIGTDTISLARLGARMTGLDLSPTSLAVARRLAADVQPDVTFVESPVYDAREALGDQDFDLVFTGIGALCWLPDVARWAETVASLLRAGGRLFLREYSPVLWAVDEAPHDGEIQLAYPYFETPEPLVWDSPETYTDATTAITHTTTHEWNHGLGEIVTAILDAGLTITGLEEHTSVPSEALPGLMQQGPDGEWRLRERPERLPLSYTLQAVKA